MFLPNIEPDRIPYWSWSEKEVLKDLVQVMREATEDGSEAWVAAGEAGEMWCRYRYSGDASSARRAALARQTSAVKGIFKVSTVSLGLW